MTDINLIEIGKRINHCRVNQGLTQEQLADKMDVSIQMISNLERGNKAIRIHNLVHLCNILNVSADYILTGIETSCDLDAVSLRISQLSELDRKMIDVLINYCIQRNS